MLPNCCVASFFATMCGVVVTQMKKTGPMGPFYLQFLAEKAGFEPAEGLTPRTLSRRVT